MTEIEPDRTEPAPKHERGDPKIISADSARQGPKGLRVLYVMLGMTVGSIVVVGIYWLMWAQQVPAQ